MIKQSIVNEMLNKISDPAMREVYGGIIAGEVTNEVQCLSEDIMEDVLIEVLDEDNNPVLFKSGKRKGEPKTTKETVVAREGCKGRTIAYLLSSGAVQETPPLVNDNPYFTGQYKSGLEGSRQRLDGQRGFRCYCGNSSILCEEEKGVITPAVPSQLDLQKVAERLSNRKPNLYLPKNGETKIDGFNVVELKV